MSIVSALYNVLIGPLELLFEVIFAIANRVVENPGLSIIFLSLAVNFLVLPLYKQADAMQEESRETEAKLHKWVTHIKKNFKGDERFMILQTYYRQNNYKPTDALKGSMSLLLEIPFFMAAYNFLSKLHLLNGVAFGPIRDLGAPDAMLVIAGVTINVLPILMTAINLISGAIYTKGFPLKSKIQLYGMALIFLVFLYDSPAGLVFYWTLNNLFSLVKNIFYKLKNPKFVLCVLSSAAGLLGLCGVLFVHPMATPRAQTLMIIGLLVLQLPMVFYFLSKRFSRSKEVTITKNDKILFYFGCVFLTILTGLLIPSAIIHSSPEEFINMTTFTNPVAYVLNAFLLSCGTFVVWFSIFYMLASPSFKKLMGFAMWGLSIMAVVNYMFFGTDFGSLNSALKYDFYPRYTLQLQLVNLAVVLAAIGLGLLVWKKKKDIAKFAYIAAGVAMLGMSVFNISGIQSIGPETIEKMQATAEKRPVFSLSKTGKNVVVIMMDRGINSYIPYIFHEKPEVKEQFAGFTYYPNTISYGGHTNFGSPGFFGGYEYSPTEMNKRSDELLVDKHNEALSVMPVMFDEEGYEVTVCDPAYSNYRWIPDPSIYDKYPNIHAYNTMGNMKPVSNEAMVVQDQLSKRNFFCYSIFKISPMFLQPTLYTQGTYNHPDSIWQMEGNEQIQYGMSRASGISGRFMRGYSVLQRLSQITDVTAEDQNTFLMMCNDTTHEPALLQEPEYEPRKDVDNTAYDAAHADRFNLDGRELKMNIPNQMMHYHANMASMIQLGKWLDYLRENGVYDNTRIIIGSDHGYYLNQLEDMQFKGVDIMAYNPLLLVKDFNSQEFTTDYSFMTNADVPALAVNGVIADPVNPFTGKIINSDAKTQTQQRVFLSKEYNTTVNNGTTFIPGEWMSVKDNIFDPDNWEHLDLN